jgi:hypothetical protein
VLIAVSHNRVLRAAWFVFAVEHLLNGLAPVLPPVSRAWADNALTGVFAVRLIVAGARRRQARVLIVALAVFVAAALRIAATGYANRVRSGHSVIGCFRDNIPTDLTTLPATLPPSAATT